MSLELNFKSLIGACLENDIDKATKLLEVKGMRESLAAEGIALLTEVAQAGHKEALELLLTIPEVKRQAIKKYPNVFEVPETDGRGIAEVLIADTFLEALTYNDIETLEKLSKKDFLKQEVHASWEHLFEISLQKDSKVTKVIIEMIDVEKMSSRDFNKLLKMAIDHDNAQVVTMLLNACKNGNDNLISKSFQKACVNNKIDMVQALLKQDAVMILCTYWTLFIPKMMVIAKNIEIMRMLLDAGYLTDIASSQDNKLLNLAIENDDPKMMELLFSIDSVKNLAYEKYAAAFENGKEDGFSEIEVLFLNAFLNACINNDIDLVNKLSKKAFVQKFCLTFDSAFLHKIKLNSEVLNVLLSVPGMKEKHSALIKSLESSALNKKTAFLYQNSLLSLSRMIFVEEVEGAKKEKIESTLVKPVVIYNNTHYISSTSSNVNNYQMGNPLFVDAAKTTPIGYNIHFPPKNVPIKNVVVEVYGGFRAIERNEVVFKPGALNSLENHFIHNGTIVVTLNLPDLLKLVVNQSDISESLHQEIHDAINQFYQTLKYTPELIHDELKDTDFKNLGIFLFGGSYGGRTAVRHAQLYPHTFSGYISHDGYLSFDMAQKADLINRPQYGAHLDPSPDIEIKKISEPILLLQNRDDNNVNAKVTLDFYKKLVKNDKAALARICLTQKGSSIKSRDSVNKGHGLPENKADFRRYAETILGFMEKGPSSLPAITHWQAYHHNKLANKNYKSGTVQQRFISIALDRARLQFQEDQKLRAFGIDETEAIWEEHFLPLFYSLHYVEKLTQDQVALKQEIARLQVDNLLSDEVIKKALAIQSDAILQYFEEFHGVIVTKNDILNNPDMINIFRNQIFLLETQKPSLVKFMLDALYQGNPTLLAPLYPDFQQDPQLQKKTTLVKDKLKRTISRERTMIRNIWKEAANKAVVKAKLEKTPTATSPMQKKKNDI